MSEEKTFFKNLCHINVNDKVEQKGNLTYLSWAWAWFKVKEQYPDAQYKIKKFNHLPYVHDPNTGYMVFTKVTIEGITHEMWLPVMDNRNNTIKENATMFHINKTIMRCLTKNLAMFGLGLYIYAGEDTPEKSEEEQNQEIEELKKQVDEITDLEKLRIFYQDNKGKGAKLDKYITEKGKQLRNNQ